MKYDSFDDKEYFMYGAAFSGKKSTFYNVENKAWYKKNTKTVAQTASATLVTTTGVAVTQITNGKVEGASTPVTGISTIGNAAAAAALSWANMDIDYSRLDRNEANNVDNSSFVSRIYHTVIDDDNTYATGNKGITNSCLTSLDLWKLIDTFVSQRIIVAANCCPVSILCPGDVVVYSENKTNAVYFYATSCGIFVGDNKIAKASNANRQTTVEFIDTSKVVLVARPNLALIHEYGLTLPVDKVGVNIITTPRGTYAVPVFVDDFYAYCQISDNADY